MSALVLIVGAAVTAPSAQPRPAIRVWTRAIAIADAWVTLSAARAVTRDGLRLQQGMRLRLQARGGAKSPKATAGAQ